MHNLCSALEKKIVETIQMNNYQMEYKNVVKQEKSRWIEHTTSTVHRLFKFLHSNQTTIMQMSLVILL